MLRHFASRKANLAWIFFFLEFSPYATGKKVQMFPGRLTVPLGGALESIRDF
jgi:hypothetical protein